VNELFRGSKPIIGPVQVLEKKSEWFFCPGPREKKITLISDSIKSKILLFADDEKLYRVIESRADCIILQEDLDRLYQWSIKWQLYFNPSKCQLLRLGMQLRSKLILHIIKNLPLQLLHD
jgi:hypothetical protein